MLEEHPDLGVSDENSNGWRRVGSVVRVVQRIAQWGRQHMHHTTTTSTTNDIPTCITELQGVASELLRRRVEVCQNVADERIVVLEGVLQCFEDLLHSHHHHHQLVDCALRVRTALFPMGLSFSPALVSPTTKAQYSLTASPRNKPLQHSLAKSRCMALNGMKVSRGVATLRITGPLLQASQVSLWELHRGYYRNSPVAVKLYANNPASHASFRSELDAQSRLSYHPNIPSLIAWGPGVGGYREMSPLSEAELSPGSTTGFQSCENSNEGTPCRSPQHSPLVVVEESREGNVFGAHLPEGPFIILEHIDGPLEDVLEVRKLGKDAHKVVLGQVLRAVLHLHHAVPRPLVHGAINGVNVLIAENGTTKLTSIETAIEADVTECDSENSMGTRTPSDTSRILLDCHNNPCYQAPETLCAVGRLLPSSDIYSIGCLMYKLLTGLDPALDPSRMVATLEKAQSVIPGFWYALIRRCISEDEEKRPSCAALLAVLENMRDVEPGAVVVEKLQHCVPDGSAAWGAELAEYSANFEFGVRGSNHHHHHHHHLEHNPTALSFTSTLDERHRSCNTQSSDSDDDTEDTHDPHQDLQSTVPLRSLSHLQALTYTSTVPLVTDTATPRVVKNNRPLLGGLGTEALLARVPYEGEKERDASGSVLSQSTEGDWVMERKGRLLEIEKIKDEIRALEGAGQAQPFGFRQHVAEKISMTHFRACADVTTVDSLALLRENAGKYKGTVYGELSMALFHERTDCTPQARICFDRAVELSEGKDAEPLQYLAAHLLKHCKTKASQENLDCAVLLLNDGVIRLSLPKSMRHLDEDTTYPLLPSVGSTVILPNLSGTTITWSCDTSMPGGVRLCTDPSHLQERRRIGGKFISQDEAGEGQWASSPPPPPPPPPASQKHKRRDSTAAPPLETIWKNGISKIGAELQNCGTWIELGDADLSRNHRFEENLAAALKLYEEAAEVDPTHLPAMLGYAEALCLAKRWHDAASILLSAIKYSPESPAAHAKLAELYHFHIPEEIYKAEASYKTALKLSTDSKADVACLKGNFASYLVQRGAKSCAIILFREALEADPLHLNNLYNAGVFLKLVGETSMRRAAESHREWEVATRPSLVACRLLDRAGELGQLCAKDEAERVRRRLISYQPRFAQLALANLSEDIPVGVIPPYIDSLVSRLAPKDVPHRALAYADTDVYVSTAEGGVQGGGGGGGGGVIKPRSRSGSRGGSSATRRATPFMTKSGRSASMKKGVLKPVRVP